MELVLKAIGGFIGIVVIGLVVLFVASIPLYYFWNDLMPKIFALQTITLWQAFKLSILCSCLFKSTSKVSQK